jgi:hypothetical protein
MVHAGLSWSGRRAALGCIRWISWGRASEMLGACFLAFELGGWQFIRLRKLVIWWCRWMRLVGAELESRILVFGL